MKSRCLNLCMPSLILEKVVMSYESIGDSQKRTRLYRGECMLEFSRKLLPIGTKIGPPSGPLMPYTVGILFSYHGNNLLTV